MGTLDQIKEINLLKNKISELEAKIQNKDNDFTDGLMIEHLRRLLQQPYAVAQ